MRATEPDVPGILAGHQVQLNEPMRLELRKLDSDPDAHLASGLQLILSKGFIVIDGRYLLAHGNNEHSLNQIRASDDRPTNDEIFHNHVHVEDCVASLWPWRPWRWTVARRWRPSDVWGAALLEQAILFVAGVAGALESSYPEECFRVVLNANPYLEEPPSRSDFSFTIIPAPVFEDQCGWVVRFHKLRAGQESWPDPLADYPQPALTVTVGS